MDDTEIWGIASSKARLHIATLLSERPRTLAELAVLAGISVQGVLKHLVKLQKLRLLGKLELGRGRYLGRRKLYSLQRARVHNYEEGRTLVVALHNEPKLELRPVRDSAEELELLSEDIVVMVRRVREQVKRTSRLIKELSDSQAGLHAMIESLGLTSEEKLITSIIFNEDSNEAAQKILREYYGCRNPEDAIAATVARIKESSKSG
jgi:predicted transcriptional regulator